MFTKFQTYFLYFFLPLLLSLAACSSKEQSSVPPAPFSQAHWSYTLEDLQKLEQTAFETTGSVYGGSSYLFPATYLDHQGTIKYMFDENNQLVAIAFFYEGTDAAQVAELARQIQELAHQEFGESIHSETAGHNSGEKWVRKEGNVLLSVLTTEEANALQYSFLHPSISSIE